LAVFSVVIASTARMGKDKKKKKFVETESPFSKTDMQRVGMFKECGYVSVGDPYTVARSEYAYTWYTYIGAAHWAMHNVTTIVYPGHLKS